MAVRFRFLPVASLMSLVLLATLACGYFGVLALFFRPRVPVVGGMDAYSVLQVGYGQVSFLSLTRQTPTGQTFRSPGMHPIVEFRPFRPPSIRVCIWGFDARRLHGDFRESALMIDCPIWCAALPLLIAPALWFRKRRKNQPGGFSVIEASRGDTSVATITRPPSASV